MNTMPNTLLHHLRSLAAKQASGTLSDRQLLEAFLTQRSEMAFAALVQRHGPMVLSVCRRVLRNHHDAEDAFQAVFLVLVRKAASIRKQESLSSFLHGVAYHVAAKLKRTAARRAARERTQARPPFDDPCDDLTWRELRWVLDEELAKLPEQHRAPLVLCYLEGKTQDEAARLLGWSKSTFRRRLEQGRDTLGRRLTRRGVTLTAAMSAPLLADAAAQAALPPLLAANTVRAGLASALGNTVSGIVSAQVVALAEGGVASLLAKKATVAVVLLASLMLGAGGLLAHRAIHSCTFAEAPPALPLPSPPARSASKKQAIEIKGRILGPDGKPLPGAKVYISTYNGKDKGDPNVRTESDVDGRFRFMANPTAVDRDEMVAAVAPGYGPDWVSLSEARNGKELTLRLVKDDVPIKGRVLDLEGRPIAGAAVRLLRVLKMPREDLAPWLKELQAKAKDRDEDYFYDEVMSSVWGLLETPRFVKTDASGRFQLRGFGRDRIVLLRIEGAGIEYRRLSVMTRSGLANLPPDKHGTTFDHLAAPSKPVRGIVRERGTGKPLAGVQVICYPSAGQRAITDKEGHYEVPGIRKSKQYVLSVGGPAIIEYEKEVSDTAGLDPLIVDFNVERGLVVRIRVREKSTGKPVPGLVEYRFRTDNRNLDRYPTYGRNHVSRTSTDKDGVCDQVVLPGPGYLAFWARDERFARSWLKDHKGGNHLLLGVPVQPLLLEQFHAVVLIEPSAKDPKSLFCDIVLERGRCVSGTIADAEGRPLSGTLVYGLRAVMPYRARRESEYILATPRFTATGLDPRHPRTLVFYHPEKKLAKTVVVRGDEKGPLTVRLGPLGSVAGRLVDAAGKPQAGLKVSMDFDWEQKQVLPFEATVLGINDRENPLLSSKTITDKEGRFRIEGLIAGLKYLLDAGRGERYFGAVLDGVSAKAGAAVDVGEIKMKAPTEKE